MSEVAATYRDPFNFHLDVEYFVLKWMKSQCPSSYYHGDMPHFGSPSSPDRWSIVCPHHSLHPQTISHGLDL